MRSASDHAGGRTIVPPPFSAAVDRASQLALICAYRAQTLWCRVRRPRRTGARVAVWCEGRLLLVRHSYKPGYFLPGGEIGRGETAVMAASRELREEVGLAVDPDRLSPAGGCAGSSGSGDTFEYRMDGFPEVRIDNREIVEARFVDPADAAGLGLSRGLLEYMTETAAGRTDVFPDSG